MLKYKIVDGAIVYSDGRVFNIRSGRFYKLYKNNSGYLGVEFGGKKYMVHRLIASLFVHKKDKERDIVDHIDADKENNDYRNLQWLTVRENIHKSYIQSGVGCVRNYIRCKLYKDDEFIKEFKSIKSAGEYAEKEFGISASMLTKHKQNKGFRIVKC